MSFTDRYSDDCTGSAGSLVGQTLNNGLGGTATVTYGTPTNSGTFARDGGGFAALTGSDTSVFVVGDPDTQDSEANIDYNAGAGAVYLRRTSGNHLLAYTDGSALYLFNKFVQLVVTGTIGTLSSGQRLTIRATGDTSAATVEIKVDGTLRATTDTATASPAVIPTSGVSGLYSSSVLEISGFEYLTEAAPPATKLAISAATTSLTQRAITVTVTVQDAGGSTVTGNTDTIVITPHLLTLTGQFTGTLSVAAVAGVATFSLTFTGEQGATYTYAAASGVLTGATTATVTNSVRSLVETAVTIT